MKKTKTTFLLAEICLGILLLFCVHLIFEDEKPQKRVAVIVEKSGDEKWNSFMNGLKQAAGIANIHLIICNTDEIENADEEKNLIYDQLDNQVDAYDFACFINAFSSIDGFDAMPWITRTAIFNHHYHNNVSKPTLERWHHHLVESGNMVKFAKGALWRTFKDEDGYIVQKRVEPDSQEYQEYCEKRWAYLNGSGFDGADKETRKNTWGSMVYNLMPDYGVYYYCPSSILNALGDQAEEIARLVAQVMAERQEAEKENDEL